MPHDRPTPIVPNAPTEQRACNFAHVVEIGQSLIANFVGSPGCFAARRVRIPIRILMTRWWTFGFRAESQLALATAPRPVDLSDRISGLDARLRNVSIEELQADERLALEGLLRTVQQLTLSSSGDD